MNKFIIISGLLLSFLFGQDVPEKEIEYLELQSKKQLAEQQMDSLNQSLELAIKEIDKEKLQNKDKNKLANLMSKAFTISKEIEKKENKIKSLNGSIIKLEKELNTIYSRHMISIENKLNSNTSEQEKSELEQELMLLAEKRIRVIPLFQSFRFNPERINKINLENVTDEFEKEISLDYLHSALAQVDSNINIIAEKTKEFEDNRRLEEKADLFMGDVAESQILGFYESASADAMAEPTDRYNTWTGNEGDWDYVEKNAIANTIDFLSQLEYMGMLSDDRINRYKIKSDSPVTEEEYLEILNSSRNFLVLYRNMLLNKIAGE